MLNLRKTLSKILKGIEIREVIWENPNPTAAFGSVTINEQSSGWVNGKKISDYNNFKVEIKRWGGGYSDTNPEFCGRFLLDLIDKNTYYVASSCMDDFFRYRTMRFTDNSIIFNNAIQVGSYGGWGNRTERPDSNIPTKIYGIKYLGGASN